MFVPNTQSASPNQQCPPEDTVLAEFHVAAMATAVLSLLEGRTKDPHAVAAALAHNAA